jgi:hypothetical protein
VCLLLRFYFIYLFIKLGQEARGGEKKKNFVFFFSSLFIQKSSFKLLKDPRLLAFVRSIVYWANADAAAAAKRLVCRVVTARKKRKFFSLFCAAAEFMSKSDDILFRRLEGTQLIKMH